MITLPNPFDIGLPYINPICLLPESKGKSKDWDGILFTALGNYTLLRLIITVKVIQKILEITLCFK